MMRFVAPRMLSFSKVEGATQRIRTYSLSYLYFLFTIIMLV
jgi:hypothetical protein